jgi:hypothetical protein
MAATAPLIHPCNVIAAAAAKLQVPSGKAAIEVYRGLGVHRHYTVANFWNGLVGHLGKEVVRSIGRIGGYMYMEPLTKEKLPAVVAPHALAFGMSVYEVCFANPADVLKSYRSTGMPVRQEDLFKGSIGNFGRQYGMWFTWSKTNTLIMEWQNKSGTDPKSLRAIGFRSVIQGIACTVVTYPVELALRTIQVRAGDYKVRSFSETVVFCRNCFWKPQSVKEGAYYQVVSDLLRKNGIRGLMLGWVAKCIGNVILLANANFMPSFTASANIALRT